MPKFSERSLKNLTNVHPKLVTLAIEAIKHCPIDFTIVCGVRTQQEQQELYKIGRTVGKKGATVTNADGVKNKSNHQVKIDGFGHAIDLYPFFDGKVQVNHKDTIAKLGIIASHFKSVGEKLNIQISWGGDWKKFKDYPHFELK